MADILTTTQAAELTGYTRKHVTRLVESGHVKGRRFGRAWMIDKASLLAYVRKTAKAGAKRGPKPKV
jgi:excisionase family DNA binding protein